MRVPSLAVAVWAGLTSSLPGQSAHLAALEHSAPAPIVEPNAGLHGTGIAALWADPTSAPGATGAFLSTSYATFGGVYVFHGGAAFRLGPRWSVVWGSTEIRNLFDTTLTNQDPALSRLRARALWSGLDATVAMHRVVTSAGVAFAADENVGVFRSSTVARLSVRVLPWRPWLSLGAHTSVTAGGSISGARSGRHRLDLVISHDMDIVRGSVTAALTSGSIWQYSETGGGLALAMHASIASRVELGAGLGRYATRYGTTRYEWYRSAALGLRLSSIRVDFRYADSRLGLGSGYSVSLGYEPDAP